MIYTGDRYSLSHCVIEGTGNDQLLTAPKYWWADHGLWGDDVTFTVSADGLLKLVGTGMMEDYPADLEPLYPEKVTSVYVGDGITSVGANAYADFDLSYAYIPKTVKSIDETAFSALDVVYCYEYSYVETWA